MSQKVTSTNWMPPGQITHFCQLPAALVPPLLVPVCGVETLFSLETQLTNNIFANI
ncbi:hypothetical protein RO3G_02146 [Rhizopus delemar RA 99-880]|uniref:Uncharacterized protein n=1 Tax=Rhizopus delemar (strain RA 99-880 / ATCC MYA-4621 / FGSC 9543 / NRRL 43880) TaxID=246409 RepID=I1BML2_RHIO9|nr:hypothetical protein RO3G_02146 [Rhizopus delemar RA 99-880]|eukprot:EIE77442.1 hypothetical protein RO3G_02146 [Rhizopus delemar RA 99-880]